MEFRLAGLVAFSLLAGRPGASLPVSARSASTTAACPKGEVAHFAFWAGTWDYAIAGYDPGVTTVTPANDGCQLQEEFVDIKKNQAHTTIVFDPGSQKWKRLVADPFRTYRSSGVFAADGSIAFYETPTERETYRPADHDHVHFLGESSKDGGKTWKVQFEAVFTRHQ